MSEEGGDRRDNRREEKIAKRGNRREEIVSWEKHKKTGKRGKMSKVFIC